MTSDPFASPDPPPPPPGAPAPPPPQKAPPPTESAVKFTKAAALWGSLILGFLILVILLIFIAQNTQDVSVSFLAWSGTAPLAVSLLIATIAGLFLAGVAGSLRILQLRRRVRREKRR